MRHSSIYHQDISIYLHDVILQMKYSSILYDTITVYQCTDTTSCRTISVLQCDRLSKYIYKLKCYHAGILLSVNKSFCSPQWFNHKITIYWQGIMEDNFFSLKSRLFLVLHDIIIVYDSIMKDCSYSSTGHSSIILNYLLLSIY